MVNDYSDTWYTLFLQPIRTDQTESEIAFIIRNLPRPRYQSIVDLCCGTGRHARLLAAKGYQVIDETITASPGQPRMQLVFEKDA